MKSIKKAMAVICAAACASASFALAACGGNYDGQSENKEPTVKGEKVTELQWKEAIVNTRLAENYTLKFESTENGEPGEVFIRRYEFDVDIANRMGHCYTNNYPLFTDKYGAPQLVTTTADIYCVIESGRAYTVTLYGKKGEMDVKCATELYDLTPNEIIEGAIYLSLSGRNPITTLSVYEPSEAGVKSVAYESSYNLFSFDDIKSHYAYETKIDYTNTNYGYYITIANGYVQSIKTTTAGNKISKGQYTYAYGATNIILPSKVRQAIDDYDA